MKPATDFQNERVGIVTSHRESAWVSCQYISRNLFSSYERLFSKEAIRIFRIPHESSQLWPLAREIRNANLNRLVFIDHDPHPGMLLRTLISVYGRHQLPPIYFHIYGDFTLYPKEWGALDEVLRRAKCHFICASPRQRGLVDSFLGGRQSASVCHFPTDTSQFKFDPEIRASVRARLGLGPKDVAVVYTGRLSLQKNVTLLIGETAKFFKKTNGKRIHLYLAGPYDDLGAPFFKLSFQPGTYFQLIKSACKSDSSFFKKHLHYLGNLTPLQLQEIYCATDLFASLSLHHDEDYGMSPAEALCCGLPVILTDWGGFASFQKDRNSCRLIPVKLSPLGPAISEPTFHAAMKEITSSLSEGSREARSHLFQSILSVEAAAKTLAQIHGRPLSKFQGFNKLMRKYGENFENKGMYDFLEGKSIGLYREIYGNYTKD